MKRKDIKELRVKDIPELKKLLDEATLSLTKLRMELATIKTKNIRAIARKKDEIAKILTIIREKELLKEEK